MAVSNSPGILRDGYAKGSAVSFTGAPVPLIFSSLPSLLGPLAVHYPAFAPSVCCWLPGARQNLVTRLTEGRVCVAVEQYIFQSTTTTTPFHPAPHLLLHSIHRLPLTAYRTVPLKPCLHFFTQSISAAPSSGSFCASSKNREVSVSSPYSS